MYEYVVWELLHNTWLCIDNILMRHGAKGVPIGFLSAQIMILCAIAVEIPLMCPQGVEKHMRTIQQVYKKRWFPHFSLTFQNPSLVPKNLHFFESYGMRGWFDEENKILRTVILQDVTFDVQMLQL